jgi:hypothetical protein
MNEEEWLKMLREMFPDGIIHDHQILKPKLKREVCRERLAEPEEADDDEWPEVVDVDGD